MRSTKKLPMNISISTAKPIVGMVERIAEGFNDVMAPKTPHGLRPVSTGS